MVGRGALLRDPQDVDGWVDALAQILTDRHLREELISRGMERVKDFTWERNANLTLEVYHGGTQTLNAKGSVEKFGKCRITYSSLHDTLSSPLRS